LIGDNESSPKTVGQSVELLAAIVLTIGGRIHFDSDSIIIWIACLRGNSDMIL
jgi:hypothetical protein